MLDRRQFIRLSAAAAAAGAAGCGPQTEPPPFDAALFRRPARSRTAILAHAQYDDALADTVLRGLRLFPLDVRDRKVLLKPNLVEFDPERRHQHAPRADHRHHRGVPAHGCARGGGGRGPGTPA
jgi:hypothetical protein